MEIRFKDYQLDDTEFEELSIDADNMRQFAKCICDQIIVSDDTPKGTPEEIEYVTEVAEDILNNNISELYKNGEQLMEMAKADLGYLLYYCSNHGYERPEIYFFNEARGDEAGTSFCKLLLLYIEIHYWDMMKEDTKKKDSGADLLPAARGKGFSDLEKKLFTSVNNAAYICSPLRGRTDEETYQNMLAARYYMLSAYRLTDDPAVAPHAYLPVVLDDTIPEEREYGLLAGKKLLYRCKKLYVCGDRISEGMKGEILEAAVLGRPIVTFSKDMFCKVGDLICSDDCPGCGGGVYLMSGYDELAKPSDMIK